MLENSNESASFRTIAQNAAITTEAIYRRNPDKEAPTSFLLGVLVTVNEGGSYSEKP